MRRFGPILAALLAAPPVHAASYCFSYIVKSAAFRNANHRCYASMNACSADRQKAIATWERERYGWSAGACTAYGAAPQSRGSGSSGSGAASRDAARGAAVMNTTMGWYQSQFGGDADKKRRKQEARERAEFERNMAAEQQRLERELAAKEYAKGQAEKERRADDKVDNALDSWEDDGLDSLEDTWQPSPACTNALQYSEQTIRDAHKAAENKAYSFTANLYKDASYNAWKNVKSQQQYAELYERLKKDRERIEQAGHDYAEFERCLEDKNCDLNKMLNDFRKRVDKENRSWAVKLFANGRLTKDFDSAKAKVKEAASFYRGQVKTINEANEKGFREAANCLGR
ncbi:MAG: hypothetical protein ABIJ96_12020 [Elusimicrobiota bacterium]